MTGEEIVSLQERIALFNDQHAFEQLFRHYYTGLFQLAVSIVKVKEPAEEIVSDLFVAIWNKRTDITGISNLKLYLYISVKNRCLNYINRKPDIRNIDLDELDGVCGGRVPDPEDLAEASELLLRVNKAVYELPPKCRVVYRLVKEGGLSYKEVGEVLNISQRTVENHIAVAVRKIALSLKIDLSGYQKSPSFLSRV